MDSHDSYLNLIAHIDDLVAGFAAHEDERIRERAVALLSGLDVLHRTALERLVERLREAGGGPAFEQAAKDPIVSILLGLYDLAELDLPDEPAQQHSPDGFVPIEDVTFVD